jgi:hypothetical protein
MSRRSVGHISADSARRAGQGSGSVATTQQSIRKQDEGLLYQHQDQDWERSQDEDEDEDDSRKGCSTQNQDASTTW